MFPLFVAAAFAFGSPAESEIVIVIVNEIERGPTAA